MDRASRPEGKITDVQAGWDVFGSDEQKVGNVDEVGSGYLLTHKGFFFTKDLYIPFSAIRRIEHDRVYLNVTKGDVEAQGWDAMPAEGAAEGAAAGTAGPPPKPDAVGTPGLTGTADEGGRPMRASTTDVETSTGTTGLGAREEEPTAGATGSRMGADVDTSRSETTAKEGE